MKVAAITLLVCALVTQIVGRKAWDLLGYERGGEPWRYVTCHVVHASWAHLAFNAAVAAAAAWIFRRRIDGLALVLPAAAVSAGLYFLSPEIQRYIGFSGVLHGLLVCAMLRAARAGEQIWWIGLALLGFKLAYEWFEGPVAGIEAAIGAPVLVRTHLYGAVGGALAGAFKGPQPPKK